MSNGYSIFLSVLGFPVRCFSSKWMVLLNWGEVWQHGVGWLIVYCATRLCWTELFGLWPHIGPRSSSFLTFYLFPALPTLCYWYTNRDTQVHAIHVRSDGKHASFVAPLPGFLAALNSSLLPSFILCCFLSSFRCPLCFFRTGFVPLVSSSGFI